MWNILWYIRFWSEYTIYCGIPHMHYYIIEPMVVNGDKMQNLMCNICTLERSTADWWNVGTGMAGKGLLLFFSPEVLFLNKF